jgi:hypothetical protein
MEPYPLSRKDALLHHKRLQPALEGKHNDMSPLMMSDNLLKPLVIIF